MHRSTVEELDRSLAQTWHWLAEVDERMNAQNPKLAMSALQCTLQALCQQFGAEQAARFAEHLPIPLKGVFFEGWQPALPHPATSREEFLARVRDIHRSGPDFAVEQATKASLEVIAAHIPAANKEELAAALPDGLGNLGPQRQAPRGRA